MAVKKPTKKTTKRGIKKADTADFSALDSAVSELARQTAALLGTNESPKPVLPKKKAAVRKTTGTNFDIVRPQRTTATKAVLKASAPTQKLLDQPDEKLLEANNSEVSSMDFEPTKSKSETPKIVSTHNPGSLHLTSKKDTRATATKAEKTSKSKKSSGEAFPIAVKRTKTAPPQPATEIQSKERDAPATEPAEAEDTQEVVFETAPTKESEAIVKAVTAHADGDASNTSSTATIADSQSESTKSTEPEDPQPDDKATSHATDPAFTTTDHADASQGIQLFSDNLDEAPSDEAIDGEYTDIFDTEQYHPKLHDWSKLDRHHNGALITLLVLVIILGAGLYIALSGVQLPFIG